MEKDVEQAGVSKLEGLLLDDVFAERRAALARQYSSLPAYGSSAFWSRIEECSGEGRALPLEVLVKVLRESVAREDELATLRLFEILIARLQPSNEQWINTALASIRLLAGEQRILAADLYADLCELLLRFLKDPEQRFWEENFQHSLRFARKHAYENFMRHEGRWRKLTPGPGKRVPHTLLESLERTERLVELDESLDVCDERAEQAFEAVEREDIAALVLSLPARLRAIVWFIFWEGHTEKTVGRLLDISDRTVRNRLRAALAQLRQAFEAEQEVIDGESA